MNKLIHFILLYFILINNVALADTNLVTNNKIEIFTENYPPYTYINADGIIVGKIAEKIKTIVNKANLDYEIIVLPWKRALAEQKRTPSSLIYPLTRNSVREQHYLWLDPFRTLKLSLYGLSDKFAASHNILKDANTFACYTESSFCTVLE
jgi:polar amino acid transport system substrate-binding protein